MTETVFRFAIMGAGKIAVRFCDAVRRMPSCEVAAVASKSMQRAEAFADKNGVPLAFDSYEEMLRRVAPDAVYIAVTPDAHFALSMLCLDYRVPVLCEKAMFKSSKEAKTFFSRSEQEGVFAMEALWSRFLPMNEKARQWVTQGRIGNVSYLHAAIGFSGTKDVADRIFNPALYGGAALDLTVYAYQLATFFLGSDYQEVDGRAVWNEAGVDVTDHVTLIYADKIASLDTSVVTSMDERIVIGGDEGKIVIPAPHHGNEAFLYDRQKRLVEHFVDDKTTNGFIYEIEEVIESVRRGRYESSVVPHADTCRCAEVFDRIFADRA